AFFFNCTGYMKASRHGCMATTAALAHLGRIGPGVCQLDTPAGVFDTCLHDDGRVTARNIAVGNTLPVQMKMPGVGLIRGHLAWSGNWFLVIEWHRDGLTADCIDELLAFAAEVRLALRTNDIYAPDGTAIEHICLFASSHARCNTC